MLGVWDAKHFYEKMIWTLRAVGCVHVCVWGSWNSNLSNAWLWTGVPGDPAGVHRLHTTFCLGANTNAKPWRQRVPAQPTGGLCVWHCSHPVMHSGLFFQHPASLPTRVSVPAAPEIKALLLGKTHGHCHPRCPCHQRGRSGPGVAWVGRGSLSGCASGTAPLPSPAF